MGMSIGSGSGGSGGSGLNSEINVTPLVDVMLVLLVVFMVTAPLLNTGVDIDLPQTKTKNIEDPDGASTLSILDFDDQGRVPLRLGGKELSWATLRTELAENPRVQLDKELYIEADKDLPYSVVVTAMAVAQEAGVTKLQMLTDSTAKLDVASLDSGAKPTEAAPQ